MGRPYLVKDTKTNELVLVEGNTQSHALMIVTKDRFVVTTPSAMEVAELMSKQGVKFIAQEPETIDQLRQG